jgi:hypothetical protein
MFVQQTINTDMMPTNGFVQQQIALAQTSTYVVPKMAGAALSSAPVDL